MKKIRDFLQKFDFVAVVSDFCSFFVAFVVVILLLHNFRVFEASYRISTGSRVYYTNSYTIEADNSSITFTDIFGNDVIIYGDFGIKTIHKQ